LSGVALDLEVSFSRRETMSKRILVVAAVALLAAFGGIAYAASSGEGVINACAKSGNGQLRLDVGGGCRPGEDSVQWSQVGPQGPAGPPGPAGTSHADERFFARSLADVSSWLPVISGTWPDVRPSMTHVLTMHLGQGTYSITAQVTAGNYSGTGVMVCLLGNPTVGYAVGQSAVGNGPGYAVQQTFEAQSIFPMQTAGDIELSCFNAPPNQPAGNPTIGLADVIATKLDTYTSTQE
jgi:hypothetical protein